MRALFVVALLAPLALPMHSAAAKDRTPTVTVTGQGRSRAAPDFARLAVSASVQAKSLKQAASRQQDLATRARAMLHGLHNQGLSIVRADFTLARDQTPPSPYRSGAGVPAPQSFTATTTFQVKIKPVSQLNAVLSQIAASGLVDIGSVGFGLDHPGAAMDQARRAAMEDAHRQARVYALAGGFALKTIQSVTSGQAFALQPRIMSMAASPAVGSMQIIPPAQLTFRSAVTVSWSIAPQ